MKNKILYILGITLIISVFASVNFVFALTSNSCSPSINIVNLDPTQISPASYVKVVFEVSSLNNCNGFAVKLKPEYPFSLDPGIDPVQTLLDNPNIIGYKDTWDFAYKIRIADDALVGDYPLKLLYHTSNDKNFDSANEKDLNISIIDVQTNFATVIQDASGTQVSIGLVNTGINTANSLVVSIPQQDSFRASGATQQIVGNLAAGDYTIVTFTIIPTVSRTGNRTSGQNFQQNPNNQQTLKIQIDYTDSIGKRRTVIKEVPFSGSFVQGNSSLLRGTNGQFSRSSSTSSSISLWWYIGGVLVILVIIIFIYRKYKDNIKNFFKKGHNKKNSENAPNWVVSERVHRKK